MLIEWCLSTFIVARELRKLFAMMESAKARSVTPSNRLVELLLPPEEDDSAPNGNDQSMHHGGQKSYQFFRQQDVSETLAILMAKLNAAFKPISTPDNKPEDRFDRFAVFFFFEWPLRMCIHLIPQVCG